MFPAKFRSSCCAPTANAWTLEGRHWQLPACSEPICGQAPALPCIGRCRCSKVMRRNLLPTSRQPHATSSHATHAPVTMCWSIEVSMASAAWGWATCLFLLWRQRSERDSFYARYLFTFTLTQVAKRCPCCHSYKKKSSCWCACVCVRARACVCVCMRVCRGERSGMSQSLHDDW